METPRKQMGICLAGMGSVGLVLYPNSLQKAKAPTMNESGRVAFLMKPYSCPVRSERSHPGFRSWVPMSFTCHLCPDSQRAKYVRNEETVEYHTADN